MLRIYLICANTFFQNELGQISHKQRFAQYKRALKMLLKYDRMTTLDYVFVQMLLDRSITI